MAKKKTSSEDFARFLEDSDEPAAFSKPAPPQPQTTAATNQQVETRAKVEPNLSQSEAKVEPSPGKTSAKPESKLSQEVEPKFEGGPKVEPQPEPKVEPVLSQSEAKVEPNQSLTALVGLQRQSLFFIYESCRIAGSKISEPIGIQNVASATETTVAAVRKALQRLEQKGFIIRSTFKDGRGGWTQYRLPDVIYNALLIGETRAKVEPKLSQTRAKVRTELEPQLEPSTPCSSSDLNINNTTTTEPEIWLSVPKNLEGLVSPKQLREFVRVGLLSEDELQSSLDGFAFDLEKGAIKAKSGNPVAILIGAIKSGGYISQAYVQELKANLAEVEKARAELHRLEAENAAERLKKEFELFREKYPLEAEKFKPQGKFINTFQPGSVGYRLWLDEFKKRQPQTTEPQDVNL